MDRTDLVVKLSSPALPGRYIALCCMRRELPRVLGIAQSRGSPCRSSCHQHCTLAGLPGKIVCDFHSWPTPRLVRWDTGEALLEVSVFATGCRPRFGSGKWLKFWKAAGPRARTKQKCLKPLPQNGSYTKHEQESPRHQNQRKWKALQTFTQTCRNAATQPQTTANTDNLKPVKIMKQPQTPHSVPFEASRSLVFKVSRSPEALEARPRPWFLRESHCSATHSRPVGTRMYIILILESLQHRTTPMTQQGCRQTEF